MLILFIRERNGLTIGVAILLVYSFNLPFGEIHDNKTSAKTIQLRTSKKIAIPRRTKRMTELISAMADYSA